MAVISSNRKLQYVTISVKIGPEIPNPQIGDRSNEYTAAYLVEGECYILEIFQ